jgi:hypothetical protein
VFGALSVSALWAAGRRAEAYVLRAEEQMVYTFTVREPSGAGRLRCVVREGILAMISRKEATIRTLHVNPLPGETAVAECQIDAIRADARLAFEFDDAYASGGWPGRILQSVDVDGREVSKHDLAATPWSGRIRVPLETVAGTRPATVVLRVAAGVPDAGSAWGIAGATAFRLTATHEAGGGGDDRIPTLRRAAASSPLTVGAWGPLRR